MPEQKRLTIVQYAGDYREAYFRLEAGGKENYHAQHYSVQLLSELARKVEELTVVCGVAEEYDERLPNNVRAIGAGCSPGFNEALLLDPVIQSRPTHLILRAPLLPMVRWANKSRTPTLVTLADSFNKTRLRDRMSYWLMAREYNKRHMQWIANHGLSASLALCRLGVRPEKIVPWDWPTKITPDMNSPKHMGGHPIRLLYAGTLSEEKGAADLIRAVRLCKDRGLDLSLRMIGTGDLLSMRNLANELDLEKVVLFAGLRPNEEVLYEMREADIVVVPSRNECPEGLPLTIYEALAARTPIVASSHPMFRRVLVDGESARIFRSADPNDLSKTLLDLCSNGNLYHKLSVQSALAWERLSTPVLWGELIERWISGEQSDLDWIKSHCLSSGRYHLDDEGLQFNTPNK